MVVTTTTSPDGDYILHEGTNQEVLDELDDVHASKHIQFGHNGTSYFALVHA